MTKQECDVVVKAWKRSKSYADVVRMIPKDIAYKLYLESKDRRLREELMRNEMCFIASGIFWSDRKYTNDEIKKIRNRFIKKWEKIFDTITETYESLYGKEEN